MALICFEAFNLYDVLYNRRDHRMVFYVTPAFLILSYVKKTLIIIILFRINFYLFHLILIKTLAILINHYERTKGFRSSSLGFIFWLFLTITSVISFRSRLININHHQFKHLHDHIGMIKSVFYLINLTLSVFTEEVDDSYINVNDKLNVEINDCDDLEEKRKKLVNFDMILTIIFN